MKIPKNDIKKHKKIVEARSVKYEKAKEKAITGYARKEEKRIKKQLKWFFRQIQNGYIDLTMLDSFRTGSLSNDVEKRVCQWFKEQLKPKLEKQGYSVKQTYVCGRFFFGVYRDNKESENE